MLDPAVPVKYTLQVARQSVTVEERVHDEDDALERPCEDCDSVSDFGGGLSWGGGGGPGCGDSFGGVEPGTSSLIGGLGPFLQPGVSAM